jgi:hypothetical protein
MRSLTPVVFACASGESERLQEEDWKHARREIENVSWLTRVFRRQEGCAERR